MVDELTSGIECIFDNNNVNLVNGINVTQEMRVVVNEIDDVAFSRTDLIIVHDNGYIDFEDKWELIRSCATKAIESLESGDRVKFIDYTSEGEWHDLNHAIPSAGSIGNSPIPRERIRESKQIIPLVRKVMRSCKTWYNDVIIDERASAALKVIVLVDGWDMSGSPGSELKTCIENESVAFYNDHVADFLIVNPSIYSDKDVLNDLSNFIGRGRLSNGRDLAFNSFSSSMKKPVSYSIQFSFHDHVKYAELFHDDGTTEMVDKNKKYVFTVPHFKIKLNYITDLREFHVIDEMKLRFQGKCITKKNIGKVMITGKQMGIDNEFTAKEAELEEEMISKSIELQEEMIVKTIECIKSSTGGGIGKYVDLLNSVKEMVDLKIKEINVESKLKKIWKDKEKINGRWVKVMPRTRMDGGDVK